MNFDKHLPTSKKFRGINTKELLCLHHTGSPNYDAMCRLLSGPPGGRNVSVHYVVALDGRVCKIGHHNDKLWHVGMGMYEGVRQNLNHKALGIEICSNGHDYTDTQRKAVDELVKYLIKEENFQKDQIIRHAHVSGYRGKWDVGENFYKPRFKSWSDYVDSFYTEPEEKTITEHLNVILDNQSKIWHLAKSVKDKNLTKQIQDLAHDSANHGRSIKEML
jgi:N-acetyl-anhydromuramyl-L-alanine amidase AmpD